MPFVRLLLMISGCALAVMVSACRPSAQVVTVPEVHEVWHHTSDTLRQTDSVVREHRTVVMMLDSAEMARYGIRLQSAERAWLVQTQELERRISELAAVSRDSLVQRDTVTVSVPVEVIREVPRRRSWAEKLLLIIGGIAVALVVGRIVYLVLRFRRIV